MGLTQPTVQASLAPLYETMQQVIYMGIMSYGLRAHKPRIWGLTFTFTFIYLFIFITVALHFGTFVDFHYIYITFHYIYLFILHFQYISLHFICKSGSEEPYNCYIVVKRSPSAGTQLLGIRTKCTSEQTTLIYYSMYKRNNERRNCKIQFTVFGNCHSQIAT